jgi:hypothetical protein
LWIEVLSSDVPVGVLAARFYLIIGFEVVCGRPSGIVEDLLENTRKFEAVTTVVYEHSQT